MEKTLAQSEFLTKKEVAELLKVSLDTINRMIRQKKLRYLKVTGKVLFTREQLSKDLEKYWQE